MNLDGTPDEEDIRFYDAYGPWEPLTVAELTRLMDGFAHPWWLVGGHAIEAFTGVHREHEDLDLSFFVDAIPDLRRQLEGDYHLWSNDGGTFRFFQDKDPGPIAPLAQIWARKNARSPWVLDCVPSPSTNGKWQSKRDADLVADLDAVTWVDDRGVRFQNPEVVLHFKALQNREKDRFDLESSLPLLSEEKRQWLREWVWKFDADHPWNERLADA